MHNAAGRRVGCALRSAHRFETSDGIRTTTTSGERRGCRSESRSGTGKRTRGQQSRQLSTQASWSAHGKSSSVLTSGLTCATFARTGRRLAERVRAGCRPFLYSLWRLLAAASPPHAAHAIIVILIDSLVRTTCGAPLIVLAVRAPLVKARRAECLQFRRGQVLSARNSPTTVLLTLFRCFVRVPRRPLARARARTKRGGHIVYPPRRAPRGPGPDSV